MCRGVEHKQTRSKRSRGHDDIIHDLRSRFPSTQRKRKAESSHAISMTLNSAMLRPGVISPDRRRRQTGMDTGGLGRGQDRLVAWALATVSRSPPSASSKTCRKHAFSFRLHQAPRQGASWDISSMSSPDVASRLWQPLGSTIFPANLPLLVDHVDQWGARKADVRRTAEPADR